MKEPPDSALPIMEEMQATISRISGLPTEKIVLWDDGPPRVPRVHQLRLIKGGNSEINPDSQ